MDYCANLFGSFLPMAKTNASYESIKKMVYVVSWIGIDNIPKSCFRPENCDWDWSDGTKFVYDPEVNGYLADIELELGDNSCAIYLPDRMQVHEWYR